MDSNWHLIGGGGLAPKINGKFLRALEQNAPDDMRYAIPCLYATGADADDEDDYGKAGEFINMIGVPLN